MNVLQFDAYMCTVLMIIYIPLTLYINEKNVLFICRFPLWTRTFPSWNKCWWWTNASRKSRAEVLFTNPNLTGSTPPTWHDAYRKLPVTLKIVTMKVMPHFAGICRNRGLCTEPLPFKIFQNYSATVTLKKRKNHNPKDSRKSHGIQDITKATYALKNTCEAKWPCANNVYVCNIVHAKTFCTPDLIVHRTFSQVLKMQLLTNLGSRRIDYINVLLLYILTSHC